MHVLCRRMTLDLDFWCDSQAVSLESGLGIRGAGTDMDQWIRADLGSAQSFHIYPPACCSHWDAGLCRVVIMIILQTSSSLLWLCFREQGKFKRHPVIYQVSDFVSFPALFLNNECGKFSNSRGSSLNLDLTSVFTSLSRKVVRQM